MSIQRRHRAVLSAALLAAGKPLPPHDIAALLDTPTEDVPRHIDDLHTTLKANDLGLVIEEVAGGYRLVVDPVLHPDLTALLSPPPLPQLSTAALETLALIAYRQPITRGEIESARGASCSSTLDTLQERELIKIVGRRDVIGKPLLYGTTERFLLEFGLRSLGDLPPLEDRPSEFVRG